jgi:anti-anti-sigma regulatory factor
MFFFTYSLTIRFNISSSFSSFLYCEGAQPIRIIVVSDYKCNAVSFTKEAVIVRPLMMNIGVPSWVDAWANELNSILRETPKLLLLDMEGVVHLSSYAIVTLAALDNKATKATKILVQTNLLPDVAEIYDITRKNEVFCIAEDNASAIAHFGA